MAATRVRRGYWYRFAGRALIGVSIALLAVFVGSMYWVSGITTGRYTLSAQNAVVVFVEYPAPVVPMWPRNPYVYSAFQVSPEWFRFEWRVPLRATAPAGTRTAVSLWAVALVPLAPGLLLLHIGRHRARHGKQGICVNCGYDLNSIVADAACPECGHLRQAG